MRAPLFDTCTGTDDLLLLRSNTSLEDNMTMNLHELLESASTCRDDTIVDLRALDYVSSYDSHLMCPICHCAFIRPVRLQCDHIFCLRCLSSAVTCVSGRDEFTCPTCRTPANDVHTDVPRLLMNMCDDIRVKCPFSKGGCPETVPRGHVESHVNKYCGYRLVDCPSENCNKQTRRKDLTEEDKCVHELHRCPGCEEDVMEQDYEEHTNQLCPSLETLCSDCEEILPLKDMEQHTNICPEAILSCTASKYGCRAKVKRADLATHEQQCPLIAMSPCFEAQNARLDSMELTIRHLQQRNEIYEDGISNIRSTLVDSSRNSNRAAPSSSTPDDAQGNSNATNYLLSVHESLREEVGQLSHAITDLDARASMAIMNECLRLKEDVAHNNAAVNSIRMQVQWLINPRLHQGQRASGVRATDADESRTPANPSAAAPRSSTSASTEPFRPRRLSDSAREGTKL